MEQDSLGLVSADRRRLLLRALGVVLLFLGIVVIIDMAPHRGGDFLSYYLMGRAIVTGTNVYDAVPRAAICEELGFPSPVGMFYPPATGFVLAPFALLPYEISLYVWYVVLALAVIFGVRALTKFVAPRAEAHVWMIAVGVVLLSSGIRWGMFLSQGAPLVLGLLCWFVVALHSGRIQLATGLAALATAFKMTLALPFFGLLLLHRRFVMAGMSIGVWAVLNALGFLRLGPDALAIYSANTATLDSLDDFANINMPDPFQPVALPRLDFVYLFFGISQNLSLSRIAGLACSGVVALYLSYRGFRTRTPVDLETTTLFTGLLVSLGSLAVYHHQYDLCLFFVPLLMACFHVRTLRPSRLAVLLVLPLASMILLLAIGKTQNLLQSLFGLPGVAFLKLSFPVSVTLALFGFMTALEQQRSRDLTEGQGQAR